MAKPSLWLPLYLLHHPAKPFANGKQEIIITEVVDLDHVVHSGIVGDTRTQPVTLPAGPETEQHGQRALDGRHNDSTALQQCV